MNQERLGIALVICAPSGTGKTTLIKRLVTEFPRITFSVSCTTRPPRVGEVPGKDYYFVTEETFVNQRNAGMFAEWATVHGNYYGTPLETTHTLMASGRDVLFDIDVQGAAQLRQSIPEANLLFIMPPSRAELEKRLVGRNTETSETLTRRLSSAQNELTQASWFNTWVLNDTLEHAWEQLKSAYIAATLAPACHQNFLNRLLQEWKQPL